MKKYWLSTRGYWRLSSVVYQVGVAERASRRLTVFAVLFVCGAQAVASAAVERPVLRYVLPGGQEQHISTMLTPSPELWSADCEVDEIAVSADRIVARYQGRDCRFAMVLSHPSEGAPHSERTARFAVTVEVPRGGRLPDEGLSALVAQIRRHEGEIDWRVSQSVADAGTWGGDAFRALSEAADARRLGRGEEACRLLNAVMADADAGREPRREAATRALSCPPPTCERAEEVLERLTREARRARRSEEGVEATRFLALLAVAERDLEPAGEALERALAAGDRDGALDLALRAATTAWEVMGPEPAEEILALLLGKDERFSRAWQLRLQIVAAQGDKERFRELVAAARVAAVADDVMLLTTAGELFHRLGIAREALPVLERAYELAPDRPGLLGKIGSTYARIGCTDSDMLALEARLEDNPGDLSAHYSRWTCAHYRREYQRSIEGLEAIREQVADEPRLYVYLGMTYFLLGEQERAEEVLADGARLAHQDPDYYYVRSNVLRARDLAQSISDYEVYLEATAGGREYPGKRERVLATLERMRDGEIVWSDQVMEERAAAQRELEERVAPGAEPDEDLGRYVIPRGNEAILIRMIGEDNPELIVAWSVDGIAVSAQQVKARLVGKSEYPDLRVTLRHLSAEPAEPTSGRGERFETERFSVTIESLSGHLPSRARVVIEAGVRAHENLFVWKRVTDPTRSEDRGEPAAARVEDGRGFTRWFVVARAVGFALLVLFGAALPLLGWVAWRRWRSLGRGERRAVLWAGLVGLVLRLLWPNRMVMVFMGYPLIDQAYTLDALPKYGAAVPTLHHVILRLFGADYGVVLWAHSFLGALTVPLAALFLRGLGAGRGAAAAAAWCLAVLPFFLRDHSSESYLVPAMFWLMAGLVALQSALRRPAWSGATVAVFAAALVSLALALTSRPFNYLIVPLLGGLTVWATGRALRASGARLQVVPWPAWGVLVGLLLAVMPNLLHVLTFGREQVAAGALPGLTGAFGAGGLGRLMQTAWSGHLAFDVRHIPPVVPLLAVLAPFVAPRGRRLTMVALLFIAGLWWTLVGIDLPAVSRPRLQSPGILLMVLAAAASAAWVIAWLDRRAGRPLAVSVGALLSAVVVVWGGVTLQSSLVRGPSDEEADFFTRAVLELPARPVRFVRLGETDLPRGHVHRAYPEGLPLKHRRGDSVWDVRSYLEVDAESREALVRGDDLAYYYQGVRCYARCQYDSEASVVWPGGLHPLCAAMRPYIVETVLEERVPNRFEVEFPWYPTDLDTLEVGLYRVAPHREPE